MERRFVVRYEELMAEAEVKPESLDGVLKRLDKFVIPFAAILKHDAQRQHAAEYLVGLVSNIKRKNIESIAYLHENDRPPLQKSIGQKHWDWTPMIDEMVRQVGLSLGRADGVLAIDPSGVLKQGKASVGAARQWCGRAGKVDNCQVGVYMAYVARDKQALVVLGNPLMAGVMLWLANRRDSMGSYRNKWWTNVLGVVGFLVVLGMAVFVAYQIYDRLW